MTKGANVLLDIGTDHGLVIIEALKSGYTKRAIATDINSGPLKRAFNNIKSHNLKEKVTFVKSDGFKEVDIFYDAVVITGLGYNTIINILSYKHLEPKFYVFGPQKDYAEFRKFLSNNYYKIIDEKILYGKITYIFIKAIRGKQSLTDEDILLGPILKNNQNAVKHYQNNIMKIKRKINYLSKDEMLENLDVIAIYEKAINELKNK